MDENIKNEIEYKIEKAKTRVIIQNPFFATLILSYNHRVVDEPYVACTDGTEIRFGSISNNMNYKEFMFVECHEVLHNVLLHIVRRKHCMRCWNLATDHVVNSIIVDAIRKNYLNAEIPKLGIFMIDDSEFKDKSAEEVYTILHGMHEGGDENGNGSCDDYVTGEYSGGNYIDSDPSCKMDRIDKHEHKKMDSSSAKKAEQKAMESLMRAYESAKTRGYVPGSLKAMVDSILHPTMSWYELLIDYVSQVPDDYSFKPPDRRFDDIYFPTMNGECISDIVVALDTSGSMDNDELKEFISEIIDISRQFDNVRFTFLQADAEVQKVIEVEDDTSTKDIMEIVGRGGTEFNSVFKWIKENKPDTQCLVYLTDGYCEFPPEPPWDVIWIINNDERTPPYGRVVRYKRRNSR